MKVVELTADIDDQHRLQARVPSDLPPGPVRIFVFVPEEDEAGNHWSGGFSSEWVDELRDIRQDIYTLEDGQPVDATR